MSRDTRGYISACSGLRSQQVLPPSHFWPAESAACRPSSHIAIDFISGLLPLGGKTAILPVLDCFSKCAHFSPLPNAPSTSETADLLVQHVFRLHLIPLDITWDRGPQFTSRVWRSFCATPGASVNLTSDYHPQFNGQTEQLSQDLEAAQHCDTQRRPTSWSLHLSWVEYARNSLFFTALGVTLLAFMGFQPSLFPDQKSKGAVPSIKANVERCRQMRIKARAVLLQTACHV